MQPAGQHVLAFESQQVPLQHSPVSNGPLHLRPQPPQFFGSDWTSSFAITLPLQQYSVLGCPQVLPHRRVPCGQLSRQRPPKQT